MQSYVPDVLSVVFNGENFHGVLTDTSGNERFGVHNGIGIRKGIPKVDAYFFIVCQLCHPVFVAAPEFPDGHDPVSYSNGLSSHLLSRYDVTRYKGIKMCICLLYTS